MSAHAFAYSVVERDEGWSWRIYDSSGRIIDEGLERTRQDARERIAAGRPMPNRGRSFVDARAVGDRPAEPVRSHAPVS